jgi:transglutaminase-like putative cysteine protease
VTYDVDFRVVVTAPHHTKVLRVWMPIPPSDGVQNVTSEGFETWPLEVEPTFGTEPVFGNRFAYFEFHEPKGGQMLRHRFRVTTPELRFDLDPKKVESVEEWPASFLPYLRNEQQAVVLSEAVALAANEIVPEPQGEAVDVARVIEWIGANLTYDHSRASLQASSEWALERRRGHCSDYHGLCSALSRALGYPARVAYGMNTFPKASPSHCKAEVFLPPYGWVPFDISETQKLMQRIRRSETLDVVMKERLVASALHRTLSGFRDNTWFVQTRGTDYDLAPPAIRKVAVVRTIYAEADGVPLPEPDPGDAGKKEFAWMTMHAFKADRSVEYPFTCWSSLVEELEQEETR